MEIGAVEYPMVEAHYIQWIAIETTKGSQRVKLEYTDKPRAEFRVRDKQMEEPKTESGKLDRLSNK